MVSFAIPAIALVALAAVRWAHRLFAAALVLAGVVLAVGAHPYSDPTLYGSLVKRFMTTTAGMAMRSTPRAVPLVALGVALLLGAAVEAVAWRLPRGAVPASLAVVGLVAVNLPSLFTGRLYTDSLLRPEEVPASWRAAVSALGDDTTTRLYETPGIDFAQYRWGGTVDPITPGLTDRPYVARELVPWGSPAGADLLIAYDRRLQEGWYEPASLVPFARLISAGEVVTRNDLQYERYPTPRPRPTWADAVHRPRARRGRALWSPDQEPVDPQAPAARRAWRSAFLTTNPTPRPWPPSAVPGAPPILRTAPASSPVVVSGSGDGLVDLAGAGLLDGRELVLYAASLHDHPEVLQQALAGGAHLVITDTNRRRAQRWGGVNENLGATEFAGEEPLVSDPTDNRLEVFPGATDADYTVVEQRGVLSVQATGYGNPVSYTPEDRPSMALDGDPRTAWRVGAFSPVEGERIVVRLAATGHGGSPRPPPADRLGRATGSSPRPG